MHTTSLDNFISHCQKRGHNNIQEKPLDVSLLITIPTTPVKRRRHRNDSKPSASTSKRSSKSTPLSIKTDDFKTLNYKLKDVKDATKLAGSPLKLPGIKVSSPNVKSFELGKEKLFKYRQWFMSIDADGSGTVDKAELFDSFLSAGVVANHKICTKLFEVMDVNLTGEVAFDHFIRTITSSSMSKAVQLHKLDDMINAQSALSTETLLSQERRKILMKFVVDQDKLHDFERDSLVTNGLSANAKLAKLHAPMVESKAKLKSKKHYNEFSSQELDSIADTLKPKKKKGKKAEAPDIVVDVLPKANMGRRSTRVNGTSLGIQNGAINATERRGALIPGGKPTLLKQRSFNIVDLIKKKENQIAEVKMNAEVQDQFTQVIAAEKRILYKSTSLPEKPVRKSALEELSLVLPSQIMKMMAEQEALKANSLQEVDEEEENSDSDDDDSKGDNTSVGSDMKSPTQRTSYSKGTGAVSPTIKNQTRLISPIKKKKTHKNPKLNFSNRNRTARTTK